MEICKAPTLRLKALNKHAHIMYIEMENVMKKNIYVYINKCSSIIMHVKVILLKRTALKVDAIESEIYCLQTRPCIFQPGHFTSWDSEGVKASIHISQ